MKIIITADIHFGYKDLKDTIWAVEAIRDYAKENDIEKVFVLGDLFHNRKSLDIDVLSGVYEFLNSAKYEYDQEWVAFPGNHDMFLKTSWEINSLKPLEHVLTIADTFSKFDIYGKSFWVIPFLHYETTYMEVLNKINDKATEDDILLTHIGASGAKMNECFLIKNWNMVDFKGTKFKRIFAGHFHCYQELGKLMYCGSPIPLRFDEGVVDHGFVVYDVDINECEFIKTFEVGEKKNKPPDYLTITDDFDGSFDGDKVRVVLSKDYTENELDTMRQTYVEKGASSVQWMKQKEEQTDIQLDEEGGIFGSPEEMFAKFVEYDKPEGDLDVGMLMELNKKVAIEANDIISNREEDDV
jgi:DNA repair exonuclease SbcCD nuclease subunit